MRVYASDLPNGKNKHNSRLERSVVFLALTLFTTVIFLHLLSDSPSMSIGVQSCDLFRGRWIQDQNGPYYTNETCHYIIDEQNCMKFGRPDTQYLKGRWKPDKCELPPFDGHQFLELVRGTSMAFVGDSLGRNQMQSLLCLLKSVAYPVDISCKYTNDTRFKRWFYPDYKFTVANFWAPYLVKSNDTYPKASSVKDVMKLYLDQVESWPTQIANFDYVIVSAGHWFFRPLLFSENGKIVGCHRCFNRNIPPLNHYYGYRKAFETAFTSLLDLQFYKGVTFLRAFSPGHFENGSWDKGGNCPRTIPFTSQEVSLEGDFLEFNLIQKEEFRKAKNEGKMKGLRFRMIDTTEAMLMRPDGHPPGRNKSRADCVHWCLPGPIDTWNELLLQMLKMDA